MQLTNRCGKLSSNIEHLSKLKSGYRETKQLKNKAVSLNQYKQIVKSCLTVTQLFSSEKIIIEQPNDIESIIITIERIENNFLEDPSPQSLTRRNYWTKIEDSLKKLNNSFNKTILTTWVEFVHGVLPKETPKNLELSIIKTSANNKLLKQYRLLFEELESFKNDLPTKNESFHQVRQLGEKLKEVYSQIDRDVPEDVGKFLTAINVGGGASLDLLTEEVVRWLKGNNDYQDYKIIR